MKVKLTRLYKGFALRDNVILGESDDVPKIGSSFTLVGKSREEGGLCRIVETSCVVDVLKSGCEYTFTTERGSRYKVEVIK